VIGCPTKLSERELLKRSDFEIAHHYFGVIQIPCKIKAPYRDEKTPSVSMYSPDGVSIFWRDFGTNEHGHIVDLVWKMWPHCLDRIDVIKQLNSRLTFDVGDITIMPKIEKLPKHNSQSKIDVGLRTWEKHDLKYWGSYGIDKDWLEFGQIYPIDYVFITKNEKTSFFPTEKYAYVYVEYKDNERSYKIYQPFSEKMKWLSQHKQDVWDLWNQLPEKMEKLIITKSRKDALSLWANTGIPCTSLQGEGFVPKPHVVQQLKDKADKVYLLYDNDFDKKINVGREFGQKLAKQFDLIQIEVPDKYQSKDASDLFKNHGYEVQQNVIFSQL
jgi:hypothetical protein